MPLVITRKTLDTAPHPDQSEFTVHTSDGPITVVLLSSTSTQSRIKIVAPDECDIERGDMNRE